MPKINDLDCITIFLSDNWDDESLKALMEDLIESKKSAEEGGLGLDIRLVPKKAKKAASSILLPAKGLKPRATIGGLVLADSKGNIREVDGD